MDSNTKIGLNGSLKNKNVAELERRINQLKVENDFYANGVTFYSVEPYSANHLFGNGKWKKKCIEAFGEETFMANCDKYGNKPIDLKIACLKSKYVKYFSPGQTIKVQDENNHYTGQYKCAGIANGGICIMALPKVDTTGTIINISQLKGTTDALNKNKQMLADLNPAPKQETQMKSNYEDETSMIAESATENADFWQGTAKGNDAISNNDKEKNKKTMKVAIGIAAVLLLLITAWYFYNKYKSKNK